MGFRIISQIVLIVAAAVILVMYVQPTFRSIKTTQDQIYQYTEATKNATQFNQMLSSLLQRIDSFSPANVKALNTFLPSQIDELQVTSDIASMAQAANLQVSDLKAPTKKDASTAQSGSVATSQGTASSTLQHTDFTLKAAGSYADFKHFLLLLAKNKYQLDITKLSVTADKSNQTGTTAAVPGTPSMGYDMTIRAYALAY